MYVRPISARFFAGKSTPASRAMLALPLLVFRIHADHAHHAFAVDDLAFVAHLFYRRPDFHNQRPEARGQRPVPFYSNATIRPRVGSCGANSTRTRSPTRNRTKFAALAPVACAITMSSFSNFSRYAAAGN